MKKIFITTAILFSVFFVYPQKVTPLDSTIWKTDFKIASELSVEKNLPLIVVFSGSDWCKPCIKLREQILVDSLFSKWAEQNAVCINLDFPVQKKNQLSDELKAQNDSLAEIYNLDGVFPLVLVLSPEGKILGNKNYEPVSVETYILNLENIISNKY